MEYIQITKENIEKEHICCAMSGKQALSKKEWLKQRFDEGLVFYRSVERGKCFIEYIPAENAWAPIDAKDYMFINCLWVSGSMKGQGYSNDLLNHCMSDAKEQKKKGLCILSSKPNKKAFLSDYKYLKHKGFQIADVSSNGISLMYLPFSKNSEVPHFKASAKQGKISEKGVVIYYSDQCPFTYYWVPRVVNTLKEYGIEIKTIFIQDKESAQNVPAPFTNYGLFLDGLFYTHAIQTDKQILALCGIKEDIKPRSISL